MTARVKKNNHKQNKKKQNNQRKTISKKVTPHRDKTTIKRHTDTK